MTKPLLAILLLTTALLNQTAAADMSSAEMKGSDVVKALKANKDVWLGIDALTYLVEIEDGECRDLQILKFVGDSRQMPALEKLLNGTPCTASQDAGGGQTSDLIWRTISFRVEAYDNADDPIGGTRLIGRSESYLGRKTKKAKDRDLKFSSLRDNPT
jgi:hypothetical protein